MAFNLVDGDLRVTEDLFVGGSITPLQSRGAILSQEPNIEYPIPWTDLRVWDAFQTNLPGTAATDDLSIATGTFGTGVPYVSAGDLKAAGATTRYARFVFQLPPEYEAGQTVTLRFSAGMLTTVADTSCTVDAECYLDGRETVKSGSDLVTTAATSINSTTFANKDFTITPTALTPGDRLDIRIAITCTDAATVTAVTPAIGAIEMLLDIKG